VGGEESRGKQLLGEFEGNIYAADRTQFYVLSNDRWSLAGDFPPAWSSLQFDPENGIAAHGGWYLSAIDLNGADVVIFWDGARWSTLGSPDTPPANSFAPSLVTFGDDVLASSVRIRGFDILEPPTARFRAASSLTRIRAGWPVPTPQLEDVQATAGEETFLGRWPDISGAVWYVNGSGASDGFGGPSRFSGSSTGRLRINPVEVGDTGPFTIRTRMQDRAHTRSSQIRPGTFAKSAYFTVLPACDPVDFNNDGSSFDPVDIEAFLSVFSEGPCVPMDATCNDIDFNNDSIRLDPRDVDAFLSVFSGGACL
jgi:hypothetical protein